MKKFTSQQIKEFVSKPIFDEGVVLNKDQNFPTVSIITPSYNQGHFIEDTILSVKKQNYPNIEHIIIDGGSTDNTLEILKKYEGTYNMRWLTEPDKGQADAINKGFSIAKGYILGWLNSDDIYVTKKAINMIVKSFEEYPKADVVTCCGVYLNSGGRWIQPIPLDKKKACYKHLRYSDPILQPSTFWLRKVVEKVPLDINLHFAFDWDFFIRVAKQFNILPLNFIIAGYRIHGVNKTSAGGAERTKELLEVTGRYLGKCSWQYYALFLFYASHRFIELLPKQLATPLSKVLKKLSAIISIITLNRIIPI